MFQTLQLTLFVAITLCSYSKRSPAEPLDCSYETKVGGSIITYYFINDSVMVKRDSVKHYSLTSYDTFLYQQGMVLHRFNGKYKFFFNSDSFHKGVVGLHTQFSISPIGVSEAELYPLKSECCFEGDSIYLFKYRYSFQGSATDQYTMVYSPRYGEVERKGWGTYPMDYPATILRSDTCFFEKLEKFGF